MEATKNEVLQLRVPLQGELLAKFKRLKAKYGVESNTEVFRLILNRVYADSREKPLTQEVPAH